MAQIQNAKALAESDGLVDVFNVNTLNKRIELPNGTVIQFYSDAYTTAGAQVTAGALAPRKPRRFNGGGKGCLALALAFGVLTMWLHCVTICV